MLDPVAQIQAAAGVGHLAEGLQHLAIGAVSNGMDGAGKLLRHAQGDLLPQRLRAQHFHPGMIQPPVIGQHVGGLRSQGAVAEHLHPADLQKMIAQTGVIPLGLAFLKILVGKIPEDAQPQLPLVVELLVMGKIVGRLHTMRSRDPQAVELPEGFQQGRIDFFK